MNTKTENEIRKTLKKFASSIAHQLCEIEYGGTLPRNTRKVYDHQAEYYEIVSGALTSSLDNYLGRLGQAERQEQPRNEGK